ncbi:MAG: TaqI-like C-terminal specificity domain-containing protein [Candidatus Anstonellales archaeon]
MINPYIYQIFKIYAGDWNPEVILNDKLMIRQTGDRLYATIDSYKYYHLNNINLKDTSLDIKYVLALLNSKMMSAYYLLVTLEKERVMAQTDIETLEKLPIKEIEKEKQQPLIKLVDKMLSLNKRLNEIGDKKTDERAKIEEEIKKTDAEIDELVYKIYGITEEEKKIIEESMK